MANEKTQPKQKFRAGAVTATIWENSFAGKDKQILTKQSVNLSRSYKDKDGNWKETTSLNLNDLPKAILLLQKSYEFIAMKQEASDED